MVIKLLITGISGLLFSPFSSLCPTQQSIISVIKEMYAEFDEEKYLYHLRDTVMIKGTNELKEQHLKMFEEFEYDYYSKRYPDLVEEQWRDLFLEEMESQFSLLEENTTRIMDRWDKAKKAGEVIPILCVTFSFDSLNKCFTINPKNGNRPFDLVAMDKQRHILSNLCFNDNSTYSALSSELYVLTTVLKQEPDMILKPYYHCEPFENSFTNLADISGLYLFIKDDTIYVVWRKDAELLNLSYLSSIKRKRLYGDTIVMRWEDALNNSLIEGLITRYAYQEKTFPLELAHRNTVQTVDKESVKSFIYRFKTAYSQSGHLRQKGFTVIIPRIQNLENLENIDYVYIAPYLKRERLLDFLTPPKMMNYIAYTIENNDIYMTYSNGRQLSDKYVVAESTSQLYWLLIQYYLNYAPDYMFFTSNCPIEYWSIKGDSLYCLIQEKEKIVEYEYCYYMENIATDEDFYILKNPFNNTYPW